MSNTYKKFLMLLIFLYGMLVAKAQEANNSTFGKVLTPKGDLRILIIYAGFEGFDESQGVNNWPANSELPDWKPEELFYKSFDEFSKFAKDTTITNISKFYHEMSQSNGNFRMVADVFPKRINIDLANAYNFSSCNRLVMEKIQKEYPDFDWSKYDQRTNFPNYKFDNSLSKPDKKPDYVIIAYRYLRSWPRQPKEGMNLWTPTYSSLDGLWGINFNGYSFDGAGFTMGTYDGKGNFTDLFLHELAHELYSCPHYSGANGALGKYFHTPICGSDMMSTIRGQVASAFERWLLGWIEIKHDLKNWKDNGIYELKDFVTSGDAIRIKIPHTEEQYLWIENRQSISIYDHNIWKGQLYNNPKGSKGIADRDKGLYIYLEEVVSNRNKIDAGLVYDLNKVNGIMPLHARGNHDYLFPKRLTHTNSSFPAGEQVYWNNYVYWFEQGEPNAIAGINPFVSYRNDFDNNGILNNVIGPNGEFNGMSNTDGFPIVMEKIKDTFMLTYANLGGRTEALRFRHPDTFVPGDELGLDHNPMLINRPKFHKDQDSLAPYFLNGLYIKVLSSKKGIVRLKVSFNRTAVSNDARWCGNIICKNVPHAKDNYAIDIKPNVNIVLDKSGTTNNLTNKASNFIAPTVMVLDSGATMHLGRYASFKIINGSKLIVKKGGKIVLEKGAKLEADKNSFLEIQSPDGFVQQ